MKEKEILTFSVYTENTVGLLNRVSSIFLKRHINIESLTTSKSEIPDVNRFIIVVSTTKIQANKLVKQLEKQVEVIKAFYHTDDEIIYQESAIFKIDSKLLFEERKIQNIIKDSNSQIVTVTPEFFVLEKSGRRKDIDRLYSELEPYGIKQFVRSGRIIVSKDAMKVFGTIKKLK